MTQGKRISNSSRQQYWQKHVDAWAVSGLTQAAYCRSHSLNAWTFYSWKSKLSSPMKPPVHFVPLALPASQSDRVLTSSYHLRLTIGDRFSIDVFDDFSSQTLRRLIETLDDLA